MAASIGEQLRTSASGVCEDTTGDIQEACGNKNALYAHAQVRLDHINDLGMVGGGGGGRGGLELGLSGTVECRRITGWSATHAH